MTFYCITHSTVLFIRRYYEKFPTQHKSKHCEMKNSKFIILSTESVVVWVGVVPPVCHMVPVVNLDLDTDDLHTE